MPWRSFSSKVRSILDEVLGADNFVSLISFATTSGFETKELARGGDYLLWYGKNRESGVKVRPLFEDARKEAGDGGYRWVVFPDASHRALTARELRGEDSFPRDARLYKPDNILSQGASSEPQAFTHNGKTYNPGSNSHWKAQFPEGMKRLALARRLHVSENTIQYVRLSDDFAVKSRNNMWTDTLTGQFTEDKIFVVQTNTKVVERCMLLTTDPGDLVLDPTCGSGTTAYVAEQWGRRWITIDTSRVALALARTRLMAARFPYYLLTDSPEGQKKEAEIAGQAPPGGPTEGDITRGFVYKRVAHITLKSIANNENIDAIHAKWEKGLGPTLAGLNKILKKKWQEWDVPREPADDWPKEARTALKEWWRMRGVRQKEMDESIARRAETEMLYDQPYEDPKRVRVTGPFTVESLSPHRTISAGEKRRRETEGFEGTRVRVIGPNDFGHIIIENLKAAGVQNTVKNERLKFDRLEPYAGVWIHAAGEYTEKDGKTRRTAVCIGPEHGTVGPDLVKDAAKEAVQGVGFDLLVVCGFAFDPHVSEEARRYGKLTVMPTKINADLQMGSEFLKKTGAGNLFMYFGEPDIVIHRVPAGGAGAAKVKAGPDAGQGKKGKGGAGGSAAAGEQLVVEILGLDVYDPTTGEVRSHSTDDIASWFIDTDYSGESLFVRHAYFTGADRPYEKLQRALRAEVDEAAWSQLYSTKSRPFDPPASGKIAVKVINHYGDEVLKVYDCAK